MRINEKTLLSTSGAPVLWIVLVALATASLSACDDGSQDDVRLPPDAVAQVGERVITKQQVRDFLPAAAARKDLRQGAGRLILLEWLRRDARREGLAGAASAAKASLNGADARTPITVSQAEFVRLLQELLKRASGQPPSRGDVARYYREHPNEFAYPEVRFMRLVASDSRADAAAAKRALEEGQGWKAVISRYSTRRGSPVPGSGDMGAGPGEMPAGLDEAVYAARTGTFNGPVKTDQAWYVFQLTSIDPLPPQSLAQARDQVSVKLQARRSELGRQALQRRLLARYRSLTVCAREIRLPQCRNSPRNRAADASLLAL